MPRHLSLRILTAALITGFVATSAAAQHSHSHAAPVDIEIIDRPVSFSDQRKAGMLAYIEEHYGLKKDDLEFEPQMVVLHWTAIETLEGTFNTFDRETLSGRPDISGAGDVNVSIQFVVDQDGTIYRLQPETWMARHVIGLNHVAIGVENVGTGSSDSDTLTDEQIHANIHLIRYLVAKYPTIEYVIGHHEYQRFAGHRLWGELDDSYRTSKIDPGDRFMAAVRADIRDLRMMGPPAQ